MCGRFVLEATWKELHDAFDLVRTNDPPEIAPRYNIAPTQPVLVVRPAFGDVSKGREATFARWGLMPSWVRDPADFPTLINARGETAHEKPSFRAAMRHRRVLVPASGFYEWKANGKGRPKQPYYITPRDGGVVTFGGLMEHWSGPDGDEIPSAAIVTTGPNGTFGALHDRMPYVVPPDRRDAWMDVANVTAKDASEMLVPPDEAFWQARPVGRRVGNPRVDDPHLIDPIAPDEVEGDPVEL